MTYKELDNLVSDLARVTDTSEIILVDILTRYITPRRNYKELLIVKEGQNYIQCDISGYLLPANTSFFTSVQRGVPVGDIKLSTSSILAREARQTFINKQKADTLLAVQEGRLKDLPDITASTPDYSHIEEFAYME